MVQTEQQNSQKTATAMSRLFFNSHGRHNLESVLILQNHHSSLETTFQLPAHACWPGWRGASAGSSGPYIRKTGPAKWRCSPIGGSGGRKNICIFTLLGQVVRSSPTDAWLHASLDFQRVCKHNVTHLPVCNSSLFRAVMSRNVLGCFLFRKPLWLHSCFMESWNVASKAGVPT